MSLVKRVDARTPLIRSSTAGFSARSIWRRARSGGAGRDKRASAQSVGRGGARRRRRRIVRRTRFYGRTPIFEAKPDHGGSTGSGDRFRFSFCDVSRPSGASQALQWPHRTMRARALLNPRRRVDPSCGNKPPARAKRHFDDRRARGRVHGGHLCDPPASVQHDRSLCFLFNGGTGDHDQFYRPRSRPTTALHPSRHGPSRPGAEHRVSIRRGWKPSPGRCQDKCADTNERRRRELCTVAGQLCARHAGR
jgi:hypothetical protein